MSKLAFDYSKWDNLDTDDSDAEEPKAPIQEDDIQQKGWRAHADPILQVKDLSKFVLSYELEAVFDAQAFDKGRRAKEHCGCFEGQLGSALDSTLAWDTTGRKKPSRRTSSVSKHDGVAIFSSERRRGPYWRGPQQRVGGLRTRQSAAGRRWAGLRILNVFSWCTHEDVVVKRASRTRRLVFISRTGRRRRACPRRSGRGAAVPSTTGPAGAAVGALVKLRRA